MIAGLWWVVEVTVMVAIVVLKKVMVVVQMAVTVVNDGCDF